MKLVKCMKKVELAQKLADVKEVSIEDLDLEMNVNDIKLSDSEISSIDHEIEFNGCVFERVKFFQDVKADFIDCLFNHCDLSNINLSEKLVLRSEFNDCKLMGAIFITSDLRDVHFNNCNIVYSNFSSSKIRNVTFEDTDLKDSSFIEVEQDKLIFDNCSLVNSEFYNTKLKDVDFSNSTIEGISLNPRDLRGAYVSSYQATLLVRGLGVNIKD